MVSAPIRFRAVNNFVTWVFLRLYARALARPSRNLPDQACDDAIVQTGMVLGAPLGAVLIAISAFIPGAGKHVDKQDPFFVAVVIVLVVVMMRWVKKQCSSYRNMPEAAEAYRSRSQRLTTFVGFLLLMVSLPAAVGIGLHMLRH
jgi:hypothetical protein